MSKYDKETKFYWLMLNENFFEDDAISWLEEQQPNGRDYAYFYLKICLLALKTNGILIRKVGKMLLPYDAKKLSEITKIDFDTVVVAIDLLKKIGLVEYLENGAIYLPRLENMIGEKSKGAFLKQQQRMNKARADNCLPTCPPESEIESKLELETKLNIDGFDLNTIKDKSFFYQEIKDKLRIEHEIDAMDKAIDRILEKMIGKKIADPVEYCVQCIVNEVAKYGY